MARQSLFSNDFIHQLEKDIKKSVEQDVKKHPEKVLNDHVGEEITGNCKQCGKTKLVIIRGGKARCTQCGNIGTVDVELNWR